jgi:hypothetical protein
MAAKRKKISTTISPEGYAFLRGLIRSGKAQNLAQAVDLTVEEVRALENRRKLAQATADYFNNLTDEEIQEENELGAIISASSAIDIDE